MTIQSTTRRNLFRIGTASAVAAAVPASMMILNRGSDAALRAMMAEVAQLNERLNTLRNYSVAFVLDLLPKDGFSNAEFAEARAIAHPRIAPWESEADALDDRVTALEETIKATRSQTLEGAVSKAAFFVGDDDWEKELLADLRAIGTPGGAA